MRARSTDTARRRASRRTRQLASLPRPGAATNPSPRRRAATTGRPRRGTNARLVEEVLRSNAPQALRPAEIRGAIQRDRGTAIAFTSIRHALGQLEVRGVVEQVAGSNTWRCIGERSDTFGESGDTTGTTE